MDNLEKENKRLKYLIFVLLTITLLAVGYLTYMLYFNEDKNNTAIDNEVEEDVVNNNLPIDFKIISFDSAKIIGDEAGEGNTHMINVTGQMNLTYDEENYDMIRIEGYCLDENNNKHDVWCSINKEDKEFKLYNFITDDNSNSEENINWNNIKITYCKVNKILALDLKDNKKEVEKEISFEHHFN